MHGQGQRAGAGERARARARSQGALGMRAMRCVEVLSEDCQSTLNRLSRFLYIVYIVRYCPLVLSPSGDVVAWSQERGVSVRCFRPLQHHFSSEYVTEYAYLLAYPSEFYM